MAKIAIKDPEELGTYLTDQHETVEQLKSKVDTLEAQESTRAKEIRDFKQSMESKAAKANFKPGTKENTDMDYKGFGEFIKAIAGNDQKKIDEIYEKHGGLTEKGTILGTPLTEDASTGSYLIPETYATDILRIVQERSKLFELVRMVELSGPSMKWPKKLVGPTFTRITAGAAALTETSPTFSELDVDVENYALWIALQENWIDDNLMNVAAYFTDTIAEGYSTSFETCFLTSAANPTGVLKNTSIGSHTMSEGSPGFENIGTEDLWELIEDLDTLAERRNAMFFFHPTVWDLVRRLKNANGDYIVSRDITTGVPNRLFGYPIVLLDGMPDTGDSAASTAFVLFGDPKQLIWGKRLGLELKFYDMTASAVEFATVYYRARYRAAYAVAHNGSFSRLITAAS